jgi:hypothetical protein
MTVTLSCGFSQILYFFPEQLPQSLYIQLKTATLPFFISSVVVFASQEIPKGALPVFLLP